VTWVDAPSDMTHREDRTDRLVWSVIGVAAVVFWLVTTSGRPWDLFDRAGFSSDFYDEQARVFLRGRLAVDPSVPGPEGFVIGDSTYLYYGPFLAIVRMPLMLFGDIFVGRLVRLSMVIALVVLGRWSARLACLARNVVIGRTAGGGPVVVFVAAVLFSPALFAAGWVSVYNETELWALTFAVISITLIVQWAASNFADRRSLLLAAAAVLAATLTRAPIGFGVALALGVCGLVLLIRSRSVSEIRPIAAIATAAGFLPLVAHAVINRAKFGSWLSVPGDRQQLSLSDPARAAWFEGTGGSFFSLRFLPTTLAQYWRPDAVRFERLIPGVRFGPLAPDYGSYPVESTTPSSSLTTTALLLLILAIVGAAWLLRHRAYTWGLVVVATSLGALPTFLIGFIANRYLIDMLPPLIVAGAIGVWVLAGYRTNVLNFGAIVLVAWGLWVNASLAIWNFELKSPGFTEARYGLDDAVFGSILGASPPSLGVLNPGQPVPRDGVVHVLDDCTAVYIAEQGHWVALDRAQGMRVSSGHLSGSAEVLAAGATWTLAVESSPEGKVVTFTESTGVANSIRPLPDGEAEFDVIVDRITGEFFAEVGDVAFFLPPDALGDDIDIRPDKAAPIPTSPLCISLTD
jgi:hypothetical protein